MPPSTPNPRPSKPTPTPTPTPRSQSQPTPKPQPRRVVLPDAHFRHTPLASRIPGSNTSPRVGGGTRPPLPAKDIRQTKEYKAAARKWLSTIVALPVLMYTSYILYERTVGNQKPKRLVGGDGRAQQQGGLDEQSQGTSLGDGQGRE
ncbi:hypothetical protein BO82DRAFT_394679 [Aspergillus uvarum CBS 121591]|uniref:Uncharacterized protein n=1 Tax=Aspergillus uvarum CBS 121591 TaxID=1448315 RepID=A0A319DF76_9EURO|nr:hypothetical protein BO82DRAFT_394679 [Aspergillus uvarum CBS 121591]PYH78462.1 hypothetical protein BO82DRAFT_394679 [Aspergillus uvarum CBS 121591]